MDERVRSFVSAVVYVHNDESTIYAFLKSVGLALKEYFYQVEVVCVNDASEDDSANEIRRAADELEDISLTTVHMGYHHGREVAMRAGDDLAIGDYVFEFDNGFLEFPLSAIKDAYHTIAQGYDIVGVVPSGKRRISSRLFYRMLNRSSSIANDLDTETFRMLSRRALNRVESASHAFPYRKALYANSGLPQTTIPCQTCDGGGLRQNGSEGIADIGCVSLWMLWCCSRRPAIR